MGLVDFLGVSKIPNVGETSSQPVMNFHDRMLLNKKDHISPLNTPFLHTQKTKNYFKYPETFSPPVEIQHTQHPGPSLGFFPQVLPPFFGFGSASRRLMALNNTMIFSQGWAAKAIRG